MSNPFPVAPSIRRSSSLLSASALLLTLCAASSPTAAQTAPQLLPYTVKLVAGGGVAIAKGACPVSGFTSTDAYGDGCLATEILIAPTTTSGSGPRYAIADSSGAIFFSDSTNGLVRRIDPVTGIVSAVAGGASSSPSVGTSCGGPNPSTDSDGDGCLANLVKLSHPMGLAFDASGNLYFADEGYDNVREVAATGGFITTTGVISNVAGSTTYGYNVNNTSLSGPVTASTQSYLNFPYGLAFDVAGKNLYIGDEGNNAIEVINLSGASETLQGQTIPAGTIAKFAGYGNLAAKTPASGDCPDFVSTSARGGCYFGKWTDGSAANVSNVDGVYSIALDPAGNVYFGNEFNDNVGIITPANIISNYAGIQGTVLKKQQRGAAGSFAIGSTFGIAVDANANAYITDASNGVVWRVDGAGKSMYVVAGGGTPCSTVVDAYGDGCPATKATFGSSGTTFASTTLPGPGIFGVTVDAYSDLFIGDTETGLIREVASGTQFGPVGQYQSVTQTLQLHFAAGDAAASSGYVITAGGSTFTLGAVTCAAVNSDGTTDCTVPLTATPSVLGAFTGTLKVTSALGGVGTFPLSGISISTPITRTAVSVATTTTCSGTTTYPSPFATTLTATITSSGSPTGTVTFFANGTQIGTPQNVNNGVATLAFTFTTPSTYKITATYSGDSYYQTSTAVGTTFTISPPTFTASAITYQQNTVAAGQSGLYSFTLVQSVYTGTITFSATGLPANSSVSFSPQSIVATGCSASNTVAVSVLTQQGAIGSGFVTGGRGTWSILSMVTGFSLALLIGIRRRHAALRFGQLWMVLALLLGTSGIVACGSGTTAAARTPAGIYNVTVTATGSTGVTSAFTVPLTVK